MRVRLGAVLFALQAAHAGSTGAEEIAPFRLTGVDGHASIRFLADNNTTDSPGNPGVAASRQALGDLRTEVFVMTRGYVYHPNFLLLDVGGGPILQRSRFAGETGETVSSAALYNLSGRATLLRDKPYRGSLFYEHLNPVLSVAPGQVLNQQTRRFGFDVSLLDPVTPVPVTLDAARQQLKGRGTDRIVDDQSDRLNLRASRSFGALGLTQLQYQATKQDSRSGSPNLPIQASSATSQGLNADTRLQFGAERQYSLVNLVTWNSLRYTLGAGSVPERKDARVLLDLRANPSAELGSFGTYTYSASDQGELFSVQHSAAGGLSFVFSPETSGTLGASADGGRGAQLDSRAWSADASIRHETDLAGGKGAASYSLRYERRDQTSLAPQTSVLGERLTLAGTSFVALARARVVAGNVTLSNVGRTQVFTEGVDYLLSVVGLETRVQRRVGGSITDGQEVLADYAYDVGGTFAFDQRSHNIGFTWMPTRHLNLYYRYAVVAPVLLSGAPTFELNAVRSNTWGLRADAPLRIGLEGSFGGSFEHENRRETIAPYRRAFTDFYAQIDEPFSGIGSVRLSGRHSRVRYENAAQNVNLAGYDLRYSARHPLGVDFSADAGYERDSGGAAPRSRAFGTLRAQWRYRKATLSAELLYVRESQGGFERTRAVGQLLFRRDL